MGEHTDYNAGFALPFAVAQSCTAVVALRASAGVRVRSTQQPKPVEMPAAALRPDAAWVTSEQRWAAYAVGVLWVLRQRGVIDPAAGFDIELDSTVPIGAGLASSAAMCCAVAAAVNELLEVGLSRADLAAIADVTENDFVSAPTGGMDQLAAMLCRDRHALLCDMRTRRTQPFPFDPANAGLALLVVDSHAPHRHSDGAYRERRRSCELAAAELGVPALRDATLDDLDRLSSALLRKRARHVISENSRVLATVQRLKAGEIRGIGPLLTDSHRSMRDDFEITVPEVDVAVDALLATGALGARMTGGGFGGCVIGLLDSAAVDSSITAVLDAYGRHGCAPPSWFVTSPGNGAQPA
jgi:galactokinase